MEVGVLPTEQVTGFVVAVFGALIEGVHYGGEPADGVVLVVSCPAGLICLGDHPAPAVKSDAGLGAVGVVGFGRGAAGIEDEVRRVPPRGVSAILRPAAS